MEFIYSLNIHVLQIVFFILFIVIYPGSEFQTILPLLKSHLEGDDLNLTAVLLELTAEICKFGAFPWNIYI